jgi:hypothetical protein
MITTVQLRLIMSCCIAISEVGLSPPSGWRRRGGHRVQLSLVSIATICGERPVTRRNVPAGTAGRGTPREALFRQRSPQNALIDGAA